MQKTVAIIPARGGSKRIPRKNLFLLAGQPLISYTIQHARTAVGIDRVIVSTDDSEIATVSERYGAEVVRRPKELAGDSATSESAIIHALQYLEDRDNYRPEIVVFLQCTSPIRDIDDIDNALAKFKTDDLDSLFSVSRYRKYIWTLRDKKMVSINFDYQLERWLEQEFPVQYEENGSIFVIKRDVLFRDKYRFGGKLGIYEMNYIKSFQVDTEDDLSICEYLLQKRSGKGT